MCARDFITPSVTMRYVALCLALSLSAVVSCSGITGGDSSKVVEVGGTVFASVDASHNPVNPVAGATVSTSLDGTTTTTDAGGNFHLITNTPRANYQCTPYTITITAAGHPTFSVSWSWGGLALNQTFVMSQPPNTTGKNPSC